MAVTVSKQIEILASPAKVRSIFLEFQEYKQWQQGWAIDLPTTAANGAELKAGDRLKVSMNGMNFPTTVIENSPDVFGWKGSLGPLFSGQHYFQFNPSQQNPGGTTFVQKEDFGGILTTMLSPFVHYFKLQDRPNVGWETFNADLKRQAEKK
ncbi:hypothetical protein B0I35DRAFT_399728 [Stachybotrys elegans]|uniref:Uncharacterized protein n=1 Tax=Stachybotrys elegans TaxID=80388 RepID=A0A8K0WM80_9HYPO|nr:hypothetical protein B0I35DRAFT_399728 [Stachybotrys elegans]